VALEKRGVGEATAQTTAVETELIDAFSAQVLTLQWEVFAAVAAELSIFQLAAELVIAQMAAAGRTAD